METSRWQEREEDGHCLRCQGTERRTLHSVPFLLHQSRPQPMGQCHPCCLHHADTSWQCPHIHSLTCSSMVILQPVCLTTTMSYPGLFLSPPLYGQGRWLGIAEPQVFSLVMGPRQCLSSCADRTLSTVVSHRENLLWQPYLWFTTLYGCENNRRSVEKKIFEFGPFPNLPI